MSRRETPIKRLPEQREDRRKSEYPFSHRISVWREPVSSRRALSADRAKRRKRRPVIPLIAGKTITLGRLKTCDIQVDELSVSRRHCTVYTRETGCVVVDLQAANGTFVNERRVETSHLEPGDRLRVGSIVLELAQAAPKSRPSAVTGPVAAPVAVEEEIQSKDATLKLTPDERGKTLVRRAIDPNNPEFLTRVLSGTVSQTRLESAYRYVTTLHKISESLAQATNAEGVHDAVLNAILDAIKGDRAAVLMRDHASFGSSPAFRSPRSRRGRARRRRAP